MSHRILVADDSLTVQKVVSITLASFDYEIVECKDETQLNESLMSGGASLLLLDLNLAEGKSGYDLAKSIRANHPSLPIILLLGTFDSVDENAFIDAGINDRIVKPFESNSFVQKVQSLIESLPDASSSDGSTVFSGETESNFLGDNLEEITPSETSLDIESGDDWVVDSPSPVDKSEEEWDSFAHGSASSETDMLKESLSGWGMNVPDPIGSTDSMGMALPGVIESSNEREIALEPDESELDYPDVGEPEQKLEVKQQSSFDEIDLKEEPSFSSPDEFNLDVEEGASSDLAAVVEEEADAEDFWAADDEVASDDESQTLSLEAEVEAEEESDDYIAEPDEDNASMDEVVQTSISLEPLGDPRASEPFEIASTANAPAEISDPINTEEIVERIIAELKPTLNDLVEKHCKETIESVAWQIIPDLAENLIRNEIKEIKESSSSV